MVENGAPVRIRHFTDPACPFAFSAERQRLRLDWLYGDQISWTTHLVVLSETANPDLPPEKIARGRRMLFERYGMPMAWTPPPVHAASIEASRAVVAAERARAGPSHRAAAPPARPELRRPRARRSGDAGARRDRGRDRRRRARRLDARGRGRGRAAGGHARRAVARRPPPVRRTTSSAARPRSAATRARATSSSARRHRRRTGRPRTASTCPGSGRSRPTRPRSPTSRRS